MFSNKITASLIKKTFGIAKQRSLPLLSSKTLDKAYQLTKNKNEKNSEKVNTVKFGLNHVTYLIEQKKAVDILVDCQQE